MHLYWQFFINNFSINSERQLKLDLWLFRVMTIYVKIKIISSDSSKEKLSNRLIKNYLRDNALCIVAINFDAELRKIRCITLSIDNGDATNKRYVQSVHILKYR